MLCWRWGPSVGTSMTCSFSTPPPPPTQAKSHYVHVFLNWLYSCSVIMPSTLFSHLAYLFVVLLNYFASVTHLEILNATFCWQCTETGLLGTWPLSSPNDGLESSVSKFQVQGHATFCCWLSSKTEPDYFETWLRLGWTWIADPASSL